jgi:hypothetical protein
MDSRICKPCRDEIILLAQSVAVLCSRPQSARMFLLVTYMNKQKLIVDAIIVTVLGFAGSLITKF